MSAERTARANEEGFRKCVAAISVSRQIMKVAPASPVTRTRLWRLPCSILNAAASSRAGRRRRIPCRPRRIRLARPCRDVHRAVSAGRAGRHHGALRHPAAGPSLVRAYRGGQQIRRWRHRGRAVRREGGARWLQPFFASIHHAVLPSLRDNLSYDILRDFEPVGMAAVFPIVLVVNPSMPVNSVSELIAYARLSPASCRSARRARAAARIWPANCSMPWPEPGSSTCRIAAARPPCRTWWADRCS